MSGLESRVRPASRERRRSYHMNARRIGLAGLMAALAVMVTVMSVRTFGQATTAPPLVVTAFGGQPHPYTVPKTPWGDPDLQGVWSSDDTDRIQMSRPMQ